MDDVSLEELRVQFNQEIQTLKAYVSSSVYILMNAFELLTATLQPLLLLARADKLFVKQMS